MALIPLTNDTGDVHLAYDTETLELMIVKGAGPGDWEVVGPAVQVTKPHIDLAGEMLSHPIVAAAAGTTEILPAPGDGKAIWPYGWLMGLAAAATYQWLSALHLRTGIINGGANGGSCPMSRYPIFKCGTNEALSMTTVGAGGTANGVIQYRIVGA